MNKKFKVTFLLDNKNLWCEKYLRKHNFNLNKKYFFKISKNANKIKKQNIVIPLNYTKILPQSFLSINELVLIAHASKLPKDKGFAPVQNQILKNKKKIFVTLLKAVDEVDSGPIFFQNYFLLNGTELSKEIRYKQIQAMFKIIKKFLTMYPNVKSTKQLSKGNFNKRRKKKR